MEIYKYGYTEADLTEEARKEAESSLQHFRKMKAAFYKNSMPGSIIQTVGIPKTQQEIDRLEYFLSLF